MFADETVFFCADHREEKRKTRQKKGGTRQQTQEEAAAGAETAGVSETVLPHQTSTCAPGTTQVDGFDPNVCRKNTQASQERRTFKIRLKTTDAAIKELQMWE